MGKIIRFILLLCNYVCAGLLLLSAASPYIHPASYPILSCAGLAFPIFLCLNLFFLFFWLFVKIKHALFPLTVLLLCLGATRTYIPVNPLRKNLPENKIKLLSYNVMGFEYLKKPTASSPNEVLQYIAGSEADIVCIQEFSSSTNPDYLTLNEINTTLSMYPHKNIQKVGDRKTANNQVACYSKYPIVSAEPLALESSYNGSVKFRILIGKDTLLLYNNHLESNKLTREDKTTYNNILKSPQSESSVTGAKGLLNKLGEASRIRATQANTIARDIQQENARYVIVCGDFNDSPISYTHRILGKGLTDAFRTTGNGPGITYNQNRFYFRIDHILCSKSITPYQCTVDHTIKASDHYPVWCYFKMEE